MTYTKEDIERLVPEATWNPGLGYWVIDCHTIDDGALLLFVNARRQLEIARKSLEEIKDRDWVENALDPQWAAQMASQALVAIKELS